MKPDTVLPPDIASMNLKQVKKELQAMDKSALFALPTKADQERMLERHALLVRRLTQILERPRIPLWWNVVALLTLLALALALLARLWPR